MARTLKQILAQENTKVATHAKQKADAILLDIHLSELREKVNKTQIELAIVSTRKIQSNLL